MYGMWSAFSFDDVIEEIIPDDQLDDAFADSINSNKLSSEIDGEDVVSTFDDVISEGMDNSSSFTKIDGGMNTDDFMTPHSEKHMFNPDKTSTKNATQFGQDIDVAKLREDTIMYPDNVIYNDEHNVIKYVKEYDFNISTPDTPTGSHRVFINLDPKAGKTNRNSQFPFYRGEK